MPYLRAEDEGVVQGFRVYALSGKLYTSTPSEVRLLGYRLTSGVDEARFHRIYEEYYKELRRLHNGRYLEYRSELRYPLRKG